MISRTEDNFSEEFLDILWEWSAGDNAYRALSELVGGGASAGKWSFDSLVVGCRESVGHLGILDQSHNFVLTQRADLARNVDILAGILR